MIDWDTFKQQLQTNPNRTLGFVLGLAGCLMLIWLAVVLQSSAPGENRQATMLAEAQADSIPDTAQSGNTAAADSAAPALAPVETGAVPADSLQGTAYASQAEESPRLSQVNNILPTLLVMLALIGGLWYWIRRKSRNRTPDSGGENDFFRLKASRELFPGKHMALIEINGEHWIVGDGPGGLRIMHRYRAGEWEEPPAGSKKNRGEGNWKSFFSDALKAGASGGTKNGSAGSGKRSRSGKTAADCDASRNGEASRLW